MDSYRIDSHKLMLHPQRVADWLAGKNIAPIYMEVSPSGACNHRCSFCALDFMEYRPCFLPLDLIRERFREMGSMGLKSIMYAGEGEPFLHKQMVEIAQAAHNAGIDNAFTTNAVAFTASKAEALLPITSWIKVSCNAGSPKNYAAIHGTQAADFEKVFSNMRQAVILRQQIGAACTLGFQMVLLPENMHEAVPLAQLVRDLGADYLVVKPYSQHPLSHQQARPVVSAAELAPIMQGLAVCAGDNFQVICRDAALHRQQQGKKSYEKCQALPFWSYMDAGGNVWGCSMFLGQEEFCYGNIGEQSFSQIWNGQKRQNHLHWCHNYLNAGQCRINCRMDAINKYLWELTHPHGHVNFI